MTTLLNIKLNADVNWQDKTILIVEDVISNYDYLRLTLEKTKAKILHAENGLVAVEMCKKDKNIDVVLMDLHLPVMSGFAATREIKKCCKNITVIAQTAFVLANERKKSFESGCDEYIPKPIRPNELILKIKNCLIKAGKKA